MSTRLTPPEIANLVLRNAVPLVGLAFFHWSAANLVILYFVDTLFAFGVIIGGFLYRQFPAEEAEGFAARLNTIAGYAAGAAIVTLILAIPLGMPVLIVVFGASDVSFLDMLRDRGFQVGIGLQAIASLVSFRDLVVALRRYTPEQLGLKRRFGFVMLRWVGTMMAAYLPVTFFLGRYAPLLLVAVYIALTIFAELMPDRFLAAFGEAGRNAAAVSREPRAPQRSKPPRRARDDRRRSSRRG
jgi:hypothetical protein